jgi:hypothetical protein
MKAFILLAAISAAGVSTLGAGRALAEETLSEKAKATTHDAERAAKKAGHRMQEAVCAESDAECLAKKAKHRAEEAKDYVKDKAQEGKNKVDSDSHE